MTQSLVFVDMKKNRRPFENRQRESTPAKERSTFSLVLSIAVEYMYARVATTNAKNIKKEQDDHEIEFNNDIKNKVPQKPQHKHQQRQRYDTHTEK